MNKGFGLLEWTGAVIPQGLLVKGTFALNYLIEPLRASITDESCCRCQGWLELCVEDYDDRARSTG